MQCSLSFPPFSSLSLSCYYCRVFSVFFFSAFGVIMRCVVHIYCYFYFWVLAGATSWNVHFFRPTDLLSVLFANISFLLFYWKLYFFFISKSARSNLVLASVFNCLILSLPEQTLIQQQKQKTTTTYFIKNLSLKRRGTLGRRRSWQTILYLIFASHRFDEWRHIFPDEDLNCIKTSKVVKEEARFCLCAHGRLNHFFLSLPILLILFSCFALHFCSCTIHVLQHLSSSCRTLFLQNSFLFFVSCLDVLFFPLCSAAAIYLEL